MEDSKSRKHDHLLDKAENLYSIFPFSSWHSRTEQILTEVKSQNHKIAIACSGGADSIFTLLLVRKFFGTNFLCIHVNHGTRGKNSIEDADFVQEVSSQIGCDFKLINLKCSCSTQEGKLREKRLKSIKDEMMHSGITHLIQGHQKDDIAESFLWRLSRGASPHGLCSPQPVTIHGSFKFLRPFLSFSRKEIRENLKNLQIPWREDETNQSDKFLRNRIRKKVLTSWKSEVDRDLLKGVERSRDLIEEQNEAVEIWIFQTFDKVISKGNLKLESLRDLPRAIQRGVISKWLLLSNVQFSERNLDIILDSIKDFTKGSFTFKKGMQIKWTESRLMHCTHIHVESQLKDWKIGTGSILFLPDGSRIKIEKGRDVTDFRNLLSLGEIDKNKEAWICEKKITSDTFIIRGRSTNDIYRKLGSKGSKKVSDHMIDQKIPVDKRNSYPLFAMKKSEIIWIPGLPPSENFKIDGKTNRVIRLTYLSTAT